MAEPDTDAFRALYRAHYRAVCRYLASRVDPDHVEDVAAETFLVAWRRQAEMPAHELPWLLNTARKCSGNHRRSRERAAALLERIVPPDTAHAGAVEDALRQDAQRRALVEALAGLSPDARELLLLRHWDGLAPRDIAVVAGLSPVVARARLSRAQRRLQRALRTALADEDAAALADEDAAMPLHHLRTQESR